MSDKLTVCPPPSWRRERCAWSSPTGARSASSTATAPSTRSRTAARTTTARSPRASSTPTTCTVECPRHGSLFDLTTGRPKTLPAYAPVQTFPVAIEDGRHHPGGRLTRWQRPKSLKSSESLQDINADYKEKFGFHDPETGYAYKAPKGLSREVVESISEYKDEPQWMRDFRLKALDHFLSRPTPTWGGNLAQIDWDDIHYFVRASERNSRNWGEVPEDIKNTFDRLGIPEAERKFLSGVGAQYESEVVYHQVNEKLEAQGVIFTDMDTALREHEDLVREYWATVIPPNDNKLAALNSAVWSGGSFVYVPAGRQGRDAAAGLLPDQHREHGPVRADADHRRGGLRRPLHRGLHGAGLLDRLAALRGGRDHRQAELAGPLHDRPELVPERLQPGHQAGHRPGEGDDGVGRLQPRLEADDEVPVDLPARPRGARRDPLDRLRRQRASTRTPAARSSTRRRRPPPRSSPSRSPRTAAAPPTAACSRSPRAPPRRARRSSATRCCSTRTRARTPTRRSASTRTTPTSATRRRSRRSATSSSSTCRAAASTRRRPRR